jgi:hypothetical protein
MSPTLYKPVDKLIRESAPECGFSKCKISNFVAQYTKDKNFVPSPSAYNPEKADKRITIGARRSYK